MYLLLLVFGALLSAAGIVLAASGVSIHERAFDAAVVTPGVVAVIGGLVLIGLGLALRVLHRIENAIAAPMPRPARPGMALATAAAGELRSEPARVSFSPKAVSRPQAAAIDSSARGPTPLASADDQAGEDFPVRAPDKPPEKMPASTRFERNRTVAETDLSVAAKSLLSKSLTSSELSRADDKSGELYDVATARRINGTGRTRITPRFDISPRSPVSSEPAKGPSFDSLWPNGLRPMRTGQSGSGLSGSVQSGAAQSMAAQPASAQPTPPQAAAAPATEPEENAAASVQTSPPAVALDGAPVAVTILKTGVVDGMTYTLFSDGSIEAELPQGTLRFGSIAELRNHIEQSA
jgi:hypothetical protein